MGIRHADDEERCEEIRKHIAQQIDMLTRYECVNGGWCYYDFDYGPAKHIVISAYSDMSPGSDQYKWLEEVFATVDRSVTPWVLITMHVPMYNTFSLHHHDLQIFAAQEHLEPLFVEHHVNVVFTGHIHAYQRTANVAMENRHERMENRHERNQGKPKT